MNETECQLSDTKSEASDGVATFENNLKRSILDAKDNKSKHISVITTNQCKEVPKDRNATFLWERSLPRKPPEGLSVYLA